MASSRRGRPPYADILTPAEWSVVHGVRHGMSYRTIARLRGFTRDAVKYHVANIKTKLGLTSRAELRQWPGIPANSPLWRKSKEQCEMAIYSLVKSGRSPAASKTWLQPSVFIAMCSDSAISLRQGSLPSSIVAAFG